MSTRLQIILVSIIALMAALGFAATALILRTPPSLQQETAQSTDRSSTQVETAEPIEEKEALEPLLEIPDSWGLSVYDESPKISTFPLGPTMFVVVHWNPEDEVGKPSAILAYRTSKYSPENWESLDQLFLDSSTSCGQPYTYGIQGEYFFIHKNVNPCEGESHNRFVWYGKDGKEVVNYISYTNVLGTTFSYQLPGIQKRQDIALIVDHPCGSYPVPEDYQEAYGKEYTEQIRGIRVGTVEIPIQPAQTVKCNLNELNILAYTGADLSIEKTGPQLTVHLPDEKKIRFDVRNPAQFTME